MELTYLRGKNVISLPPIRTERMYGPLKQVEAYWEGLRDGRAMPLREEVDPRGLTGALDYAFVLERIAPGLARFRLAGHHMSELMGMELRAMPLSAMFLPAARPKLARMLDMVFDQPATVQMQITGDSGMTRPKLEGALYMAPLRDQAGAPTRVLGAMMTRGQIGRAPRRFTIGEAVIRSLGDADPRVRASREAPADAAHPGHKIPGFFEHAQGFAPAPKAAADSTKQPGQAHPYLKLVISNDA